MYVFDATAALARIEQGLLVGALAATYSTGVGLLSVCVPRVGRVGTRSCMGSIVKGADPRRTSVGGHGVRGGVGMGS